MSAFKMQYLLSYSNNNSRQASSGLTRIQRAGKGRPARHHKRYWFFLSAKAFKGIPTKTHAIWSRSLCSVNLAGQWKEDTDWKRQTNGESSGVNKSGARFLPNCFVGNWKGITTIQLHFSGAPSVGDVISPNLKRLQREARDNSQVKLRFKTLQHQGYCSSTVTSITSDEHQPYAWQKSLS